MLLNRYTALFIKGFLTGGGTVIPGVSGGTVAVCTGAFKEVLDAVSSIFLHFSKSTLTLLPFGVGCALGVFAFSLPLSLFTDLYPTLSNTVFCIISLVSLILFIRQSIYGRITKKGYAYVFAGTLVSLCTTLLLSTGYTVSAKGFLTTFVTGLALALALILPAISFSYTLLFFGLYEKTIDAVAGLDLEFLLPFGASVLLGVFLFSALVSSIMKKHEIEVYCFACGFVICSLAEIAGKLIFNC